MEEVRQYQIELKIGSTVYIERWDGNGIHKEVKIINIIRGKTRAVIKTNKGVFIFSIWNNKRDNIPFKWTCKRKTWEKKHQRWVDGCKYYLESLTL
jgi:hypothetical protein